MSKTFKALQRAAKERAQRAKQPLASEASEPLAGDGISMPAAKAAQGMEPLPTPESKRPEASLADLDLAEPSGESDPGLQDILKEAFVGGAGLVRVDPDGWVRGHLEAEAARQLLRKYALLHCLRQDEENSFWFWSSKGEARQRARQSGLDLDFEVEAEADA